MRETIDANAAAYLIERYPGTKRVGLESMWACACGHIEEQVQSQYLHAPFAQPALEAAALLRVTAICVGDDPQAKQALLFAAAELIQPFARRI
jgi:hypothetical protein